MNKKMQSINALRMLGVDMVNKANSGHPGIVLGSAPMMYTLFTKHLIYNPEKPDWFNRDRFVLSAGHGSALIYATLHLAGYNLTMDDLKSFRQWGSKTPGHPEYGHAEGIEATTGPLGQGISNAVGMAIGERYLAAQLNKEGFPVVNHHTYVLCGDGDLQEGVAMESASLAGHLGLDKLIVLFDSNDIQLDGPVDMATSEKIQAKFEAMNWSYLKVDDGEMTEDISRALEKAKNMLGPTLIEVKTIIGHGSPQQGQSATHGAPLGEENTNIARQNLGWHHPPFEIPEEVYEDFRESNDLKGMNGYNVWVSMVDRYKNKYPIEGKIIEALMNGENLGIDYDCVLEDYKPKDVLATRASSGDMLKILQEKNPLMIGGSADLSSSTKVRGIGGDFGRYNPLGRNINFGVREHAMAAIVNGLVLHGLKGFAGGFFIFSDYMRPSMRLAALMGIPSIFAFTHDSVAVGEDGPTHEPVEQLAGLRAMPNMDVIRPADANETKAAWILALESKDNPTSMLLTRQNVPTLDNASFKGVEKGAYVISPEKKEAKAIIIATGSEVSLALEAQKKLKEDKIDVRVVSMPSMFRFKKQSDKYKESVLPKDIKKRVSVEMGSTFGWAEFTGKNGRNLGIDKYGASAKGEEIIHNYGFNVDNLVRIVKEML
ncbi:transketolase [Alkalibacter saccharofermentans]|uniref:Transketolase n=1 Tax=Alkalibacter saccharofermentans DSM 14828 TaxID=1120975 RepID=A0A1M4X1L1_9FIRM|nr:transketolase [Alkalibacter saccharofermentans]SHE87391.1 transketolase [Alkalibacter saccharofermentans DSM 14828]